MRPDGIEAIGEPGALWALSPPEFNRWRAENDLPILRAFFDTRLPRFKEWRERCGITDDLFCQVVPTSELFLGSGSRTLYGERDFFDGQLTYMALDCTRQNYEASVRRESNRDPAYEYEPYFSWIRREAGRNRFFARAAGNWTKTETFEFGGLINPHIPKVSRVLLLGTFKLLKLGATELGLGVEIGRRNLAFADLDYLTVTGIWHGGSSKDLVFSSCRKWLLKKAELHAFNFVGCDLEEFRCESTNLQTTKFVGCKGLYWKFVDSRLVKVRFEGGSFGFDIQSTDLIDVSYRPERGDPLLAAADRYRTLRSAYQSRGRRDEAAQCYYMERLFQLRASLFPRFYFHDQYKLSVYGGRWRDLWNHWYKREMANRKCLSLAGTILSFHLKRWLTPKSFWTSLRLKYRQIVLLVDWTLWGFGERPIRIFVFAAAVITSFGGFYFLHWNEMGPRPGTQSNTFVNAAYVSVVTFTTLGYGDFVPATDHMKVACGLEALIGAFTMGLVVAGFANRSRY